MKKILAGVAVLAVAVVIGACGGRSAACTKAASCGAASSVGATSSETSVKACESLPAAVDLCCDGLTTTYKATPDAGTACN